MTSSKPNYTQRSHVNLEKIQIMVHNSSLCSGRATVHNMKEYYIWELDSCSSQNRIKLQEMVLNPTEPTSTECIIASL